MPPGLWVVFKGRQDHHALHADTWDDQQRGFISFETRDTVTLQMVLDDQPLAQAVLFQDGWELRGMRDVRLEVSQGSPAHVRVVHRDDGLNQILQLVSKQ